MQFMPVVVVVVVYGRASGGGEREEVYSKWLNAQDVRVVYIYYARYKSSAPIFLKYLRACIYKTRAINRVWRRATGEIEMGIVVYEYNINHRQDAAARQQ